MNLDKMREDAERLIRANRRDVHVVETVSARVEHHLNCSPERIIALVDAAEALRDVGCQRNIQWPCDGYDYWPGRRGMVYGCPRCMAVAALDKAMA